VLEKNITMTKIIHFILIAIGVTIGTGAYVIYPITMYILLGVALFIYCALLAKNVHKVNVQSNLILLLYIVFLLLNFIRDIGNEVAARLYMNFFLGICAYLVVIKVFYLKTETGRFRYLPLISLIIIASGILLELNGLIVSRADGEAMAGVDEGLLSRPGGFVNPNRTAALSLIWLFCALESKNDNSYWLKYSCISVCIFIVSMTQSRAAMLFLFIYFLCKIYVGGAKTLKYYGVPIVCVSLLVALTSQSSVLGDIYGSILLRFQGDGSSEERYFVLQSALVTFTESPITGHGMRAMAWFIGVGTHNEIVEWLVNFGITGFLVMLLVFFRFYYINSFKYLCLCIFPTFLFSHNFFEATSFQVALAYAFSLAKRPAKADSTNSAVRGILYSRWPIARHSIRLRTKSASQ